MKDIVFVTAQPDVPYFHWQVKLYVHNFIEKGIDPKNIHVIFAMVHGKTEPSEDASKLKEYGINVHFYTDDRDKKTYIPSIKPYLISRWIEEYPKYGKLFFLHDADIIFNYLPDFESMLNDEYTYVSDTIGYIGYNYIKNCCNRYESQHPNSEVEQLLREMTDVVGVSIDCVKCNQENSGGGQYLIKNTDSELWKKIYDDCTPLYYQMLDYQKRFPINPGQIQFWTAEMWSLLWNLWLHGIETKISEKLNFSWATDSVKVYEKEPILHMAGVTENLKGTKFYKGDYINIDPIELLRNDETYFDYVDSNSSTIKYIEVMKSFIENDK